jgi:signal transduction histidine kinase
LTTAAKPLTQEVRSILYRAVRELLINTAKHAQTDAAIVESECTGQRIVVRVSDAGVGYDAKAFLKVRIAVWG